MSNYFGFSTFAGKKGFQLTGKDLINRDLLNHIYTLKGERVMMPGFGTRIPLMAFEPMDDYTLQAIEEDLRAVVDYDVRVELLNIAVLPLPDNNAIIALLDLKYIELGIIDTLRLEFPSAS
ncbi:GPW/gp25 family protein [Acinetobacter sp.]|uniref:GPW/gp25 family protein n=1 Tax=Acinetobacter sp. TaxID=472 RepID=UPI00388FCEE4